MDIGMIGAGRQAGAIARLLAQVGHRVSISNSRGPDTLADLAAEIGAIAASVDECASASDIVFIVVPSKAVPSLPAGVLAVNRAVTIDVCNYYPSRDGRIAEIDAGLSDSEWVEQVIGRPVVKAFNNIVSGSLATLGVPAGTPGRVCLSAAGDSARAKGLVLELFDELGFDGLDAGPLSESWRQQPGSPAYCHDLGKAAMAKALASARFEDVAAYRSESDGGWAARRRTTAA